MHKKLSRLKSKKTLLAVDIGNTTISLGVLKQDHVLLTRQIETGLSQKILMQKLFQTLSILRKEFIFDQVIICSVVPTALAVVFLVLQKCGLKPLVIGKDVIVPIRNHYRNPKQVGQDRLVCAFAAKELYGRPIIVIDFGTAITFDVVSPKGFYLGGIIVPGIRLTAESLFKKTAMLPKVRIMPPKELIGRDTKNSILSGIFFGYGALADGLIDLIEKSLKISAQIIVTGGYSHIMKKFISKKIHRIDPFLVFKGISLLSRRVDFN